MKRPRGLMDKASVSGAEDCRFESCRGRVTHFFTLAYDPMEQHGVFIIGHIKGTPNNKIILHRIISVV